MNCTKRKRALVDGPFDGPPMKTMAHRSSCPRATSYLLAFILIATTHIILLSSTFLHTATAISIKPADFDRFIMPCYVGAGSASGGPSSYYATNNNNQQQSYTPQLQSGSQQAANSYGSSSSSSLSSSSSGQYQANRADSSSSSQLNAGYGQSASYFGNDQQQQQQTSYNGISAATSYGASRQVDAFNNLGQQVPRANTIDNFIALVSKIEAANPRMDVDQLIKTLLNRFRLDNYYYDVRTRTPVDDTDLRTNNIIPAIFSPIGPEQSFIMSAHFPEQILSQDEKCSMYFMLSHFIDKSTPLNPSLASTPVLQLSGPLAGQRPPVLQAAGAGYPAQSAENAYTSGASGTRYSGPSPSFGSPATSNMNSFGQGVNNQPDYAGKNPYGMNVAMPNNQLNVNYNNLRQSGQYSGTMSSNTRFSSPYVDGQARNRDERVAIEYGVVATGNQEDAAVVLNRVLMGILAARLPKQSIRQLAGAVFTTQHLANTPNIDQEVDPLFAVTLADLAAISSRTKPGKTFDIRMLGDAGRWNNTMCPTSFRLERANSIRFTTAELLGGLDGLSLGMLRRRLLDLGKSIRLSEMLRMYYSKNGFKPQMPEVSVCNRLFPLSSQVDYLQMQAENYLRLYELNVPMTESIVKASIRHLESFRDVARQAAQQLSPQEICADSTAEDVFPMNGQAGEQCEIARADVVTVMDTSPQANHAFMDLVVTKLAQRLGLSRDGSSLTVLTNQQDSTGIGGPFALNAIVRNSTNTAEIGCALVYDTSQSYQGGQVTDPTKLVGMLEQALVSLDGEYQIRQAYYPGVYSRPSSSQLSALSQSSSYSPSLFGGQSEMTTYSAQSSGGGSTKSSSGAKVIVFFSYGNTLRPDHVAAMPTNWQGPNNYNEQNGYKFIEAKRYLMENFRGAAILGVASNRDDVKELVFDEDRDIFTDIPQGSAPSTSMDNYYGSSSLNDAATISTLNGPADRLVSRLVQRMCTVPALFQYPLCFRFPSENAQATGYITPGHKQYWMMSPKTFFSSKSVRLLFKVLGGRLRVCFGRRPNPDETALRNGQQSSFQTGSISFGPSPMTGNPNGNIPQQPQQVQPSSSDYYTGMEYGVCKDVSPGQEINFMISDPCYRRSIAECEPFYFVIKEISNPGESDPNYMCRDPGCKRFDQAKFVLTHSGVSCSSALKSVVANWYFIIISVALATIGFQEKPNLKRCGLEFYYGLKNAARKTLISAMSTLVALVSVATMCNNIQIAQAQHAGVYDFGQNRYGEKRGNFTPSEVAAIILLVMTILVALALTIGLCYYVTKRSRRGMQQVSSEGF